MEELVDISQDRGPLLFCCSTVAAPPPRSDRTRVLFPKAFILARFLFFSPHSLTQFQPLLPSAFVKDGPSTTPPTSLSLPLALSRWLSHYALIRSAG